MTLIPVSHLVPSDLRRLSNGHLRERSATSPISDAVDRSLGIHGEALSQEDADAVSDLLADAWLPTSRNW